MDFTARSCWLAGWVLGWGFSLHRCQVETVQGSMFASSLSAIVFEEQNSKICSGCFAALCQTLLQSSTVQLVLLWHDGLWPFADTWVENLVHTWVFFTRCKQPRFTHDHCVHLVLSVACAHHWYVCWLKN